MTQHPTACILCSRNCGLLIETDGHRFTKIKGDPAHPVSKGYLCQKAARLDHYQNHNDRLSTPLKRQPNGQFAAISWEQALSEIAGKLIELRQRHGGDAFAFVGGGGQGNHLGAAYSRQLLAAMRSKYSYNALGQEKTGDFWVNGRLFGSQTCHTTEDVENADVVLFIGTNPYQAHGIQNARDTLKHLKKDDTRFTVVIDPRRTETADHANIHLQLKPGTDAFLMSALLGIIVQEKRYNATFLEQHTRGSQAVLDAFQKTPVLGYCQIADVDPDAVREVARRFSSAARACVRIDLGLQQSPNSTLNSYLEKLLYLVCGHFGKAGGNNLHTFFLPVLGNTDERKVIQGKRLKRTAYHQMMPISGIYPPNILADEILLAGDRRIRSVFVDSANPLMTFADTNRLSKAFATLELSVVIDTAMTETARAAQYVLPAASQYEKWECTGFNLEFPDNGFHLRPPLLKPHADALPEPEIYTRLLEKMGCLPARMPLIDWVSRRQPPQAAFWPSLTALAAKIIRQRTLAPFAASILYRTLGPQVQTDAGIPAAPTVPLLALSLLYAQRYYRAVKRAGHTGNRLTLGANLYRTLLNAPSGVTLSRHAYADVWSLVAYPDRKIQLAIPEMLTELQALRTIERTSTAYPFVLMAGERRNYNANQIFRDPQWRKVDNDGFMRMHPEDAQRLSLSDGDAALVRSTVDSIPVTIRLDDSVRRGMLTLPHGYGMRYEGRAPQGPEINRLTASAHCEGFSKIPFHKHVPVTVEKIPAWSAGLHG